MDRNFIIEFKKRDNGSVVIEFRQLGWVTKTVTGEKALNGMLQFIETFMLDSTIFITEYSVYFVEDERKVLMNGVTAELSKEKYDQFFHMFDIIKDEVLACAEKSRRGYVIRFSDQNNGIDVNPPLIIFYNDHIPTKMFEGIKACDIILKLIDEFKIPPTKIFGHSYKVLFLENNTVEIEKCGKFNLSEEDYLRFLKTFDRGR